MYQRTTSQMVMSALDEQAAVVLLGPRQVGKTTLALDIAAHRPSVYLDLEREADRQILIEPDLYLDEQAEKLVILDEIQQMPGLFGSLRGQIDMRRRRGLRTGQFLLVGSASICPSPRLAASCCSISSADFTNAPPSSSPPTSPLANGPPSLAMPR